MGLQIKCVHSCPIKGCSKVFMKGCGLEGHARSVHRIQLHRSTLSLGSTRQKHKAVLPSKAHVKSTQQPKKPADFAASQSSQDTLVSAPQAIEKELELLRRQLGTVRHEVRALKNGVDRSNAYNHKLCEQLKRDRVRLWVFQQQY